MVQTTPGLAFSIMPDAPTPAAPLASAGLLAGKTIAITGASTGIGADAARLFAREGAALVLGARSEPTRSAGGEDSHKTNHAEKGDHSD